MLPSLVMDQVKSTNNVACHKSLDGSSLWSTIQGHFGTREIEEMSDAIGEDVISAQEVLSSELRFLQEILFDLRLRAEATLADIGNEKLSDQEWHHNALIWQVKDLLKKIGLKEGLQTLQAFDSDIQDYFYDDTSTDIAMQCCVSEKNLSSRLSVYTNGIGEDKLLETIRDKLNVSDFDRLVPILLTEFGAEESRLRRDIQIVRQEIEAANKSEARRGTKPFLQSLKAVKARLEEALRQKVIFAAVPQVAKYLPPVSNLMSTKLREERTPIPKETGCIGGTTFNAKREVFVSSYQICERQIMKEMSNTHMTATRKMPDPDASRSIMLPLKKLSITDKKVRPRTPLQKALDHVASTLEEDLNASDLKHFV